MPDANAISREGLVARLKELNARADAIVARAAPLRAQYEELRREEELVRAKQDPVVAQMQLIEKPLFDIRQEISMICRALGGRVNSKG